MPRFMVFHYVRPDRFAFSTGTEFNWPEGFTQVAVVTCETMGQVFELTNHIDRSWFDNPGVEVLVQSRSTSVGDAIMDEAGDVYIVAGVGFERIVRGDR